MTAADYRFPKRERITSRKLIDSLFAGSSSMAAYPLRAVYSRQARPAGGAPVQILVSVPKKHFHHAVDRNRVKRQIREAFRQNKQLLCGALPDTEQLLLAFVWLSDRHSTTEQVERRVANLMQRIAEKL
ncbi:MAG: ribonuclease P protein component [Prevotella sp.]|nr:ribonuclease P protein component [Prevotella sp.]